MRAVTFDDKNACIKGERAKEGKSYENSHRRRRCGRRILWRPIARGRWQCYLSRPFHRGSQALNADHSLLRLAYMHLKSYESRRDREKAAAENASSYARH